MNVLSVCSGVGGLDRGLEQAGMTAVGFCELDGHARSVLARHWPDVPCHDDITTLNGADWHGRVDLVAGGTPCTDLSVAGRRAGLVGDESRLFWDFCRVADTSAAPWVLWENVAGALSSHDGEDFAAVLWGLTGFRPAVPADGWRTIGLCAGPHRTAVWRLLDARWFGVAQRRRRVFVVAGPRDRCSLEVLVEPEGVPRGTRPGGPTEPSVAALTSNGVGTCGADDNQGQAGHLIGFYPFNGLDCQASAEVFGTLRVGSSIGLPSGPAIAYCEPLAVSAGTYPIDRRNAGRAPDGGGSGTSSLGIGDDGDPSFTVTQVVPAVAYPLAMRGRDNGAELEVGEPDIYNSLRAGDGGSSRQNGVLTPDLAVRRLTPRECERLMSWPDDWTRYAADSTEIADSHRYRMCGNGVVSNCTEWVGRRIMAAA